MDKADIRRKPGLALLFDGQSVARRALSGVPSKLDVALVERDRGPRPGRPRVSPSGDNSIGSRKVRAARALSLRVSRGAEGLFVLALDGLMGVTAALKRPRSVFAPASMVRSRSP